MLNNNARKILLSIVIPVYNVEKYLDECLESIVYQTDVNEMEIILVDDGSSDRSGEICNLWVNQYPFIHVLHQENGGLSRARNNGIKASVGNYVMFVDSDDWIAPNALCIIKDILKKNFPDILTYNYELSPEGDKIDELKQEMFIEGIDSFLSGAVKRFPIGISAWRFVVNRSFLIDNELWFYNDIFHEDTLWTPRVLCSAHDVILCEKKLYIVRNTVVNHDSITRSSKHWEKRIYDLDKVCCELNLEAEKYADDVIRCNFLFRISAIALQNRLLLALKAGKLQEVVSEIKGGNRSYPEIYYMPRKFGICIRIFGLNLGTKIYGKLWG